MSMVFCGYRGFIVIHKSSAQIVNLDSGFISCSVAFFRVVSTSGD